MTKATTKAGVRWRRRARWRAACLLAIMVMLPWRPGLAQAPAVPGLPPAPAEDEEERGLNLTYDNMPLNLVLEEYSDNTGRSLLLDPALPKVSITLKSQGMLTIDEYLQAIESVLGMNNIALLRVGDRFLKVVPNKQARQEAMQIRAAVTGEPLAEDDQLVSQMIVLKHVGIDEARKAIETLKHAYAQVHMYERINSILVTDTAANINRILQVIEYLDQPVEAREEPNIVQIQYAKASDIKKKLEELIADSQKEDQQQPTVVSVQRDSGPPTIVRRTVPGVIRARAAAQSKVEEPAVQAELIELAERGVIRGKVKIIADDRTNILVIITRPENMQFFEKVIKVFDVETAPDVSVKVFRLEFASAKDIAGMLNDLIGAAKKKEEAAPGTPRRAGEQGESQALSDYVESREPGATPEKSKSKVGELAAENIKILSDERTNSLVIMASRADLATLEEIISDMDMMLSQVLIESVIIEIQLGGELQTGVDWLQRSMVAYNKKAGGTLDPYLAFAGGGGGGTLSPANAIHTPALGAVGGLTYYLTHFGLNLDVVLQMVSKDDRTRVVSAPVILTTDNTEAKITSTEQIYIFNGKKYDQNQNVYDDFSTKDVGLELTVKPHINESEVVMMEIQQQMSEPGSVGEPQSGARVSSQRTIDASIAVRNGQTIILGGQVRNSIGRVRTKIPLLGDIPLLGRLFNFTQNTDTRRETVVFITPYVLDTDEQINTETARRKESLNVEGMWRQGWSGSELADPPTRQEVKDREAKRRRAAAARKYRREDVAADSADYELTQDVQEFIEAEEDRVSQEETSEPAPAAEADEVPAAEQSRSPVPPVEPSWPSGAVDEAVAEYRLDPDVQRFISDEESRVRKGGGDATGDAAPN